MLGDSLERRCAEPDALFRVTAKISKGELRETRFLIKEPPCFPVAPVMRTATMLDIIDIFREPMILLSMNDKEMFCEKTSCPIAADDEL